MKKIDLQIHTTHSDGRNTPQEIIELAHQNKVNTIAITDHDIITAISEAQTMASKYDIRIIPGVEITTGFRGHPVHILGYNIDISNKDLNVFLSDIIKDRRKHYISQLNQLNNNLRSANKKEINLDNYLNKVAGYYSIPGLALFMKEEGVFDTRNEGFYYLDGVSDAAPSLEPKDAIDIVHRAGGKAFVSHPFAPHISLKNIAIEQKEQEKIVALFKEQGLDGLECYQTGHSEDDIRFCKLLADKYELLISAGSDWHGSLEQAGETIKKYLPFYLKKFGDLKVPEEDVEKILNGLDLK